jgi:hypothetical protein
MNSNPRSAKQSVLPFPIHHGRSSQASFETHPRKDPPIRQVLPHTQSLLSKFLGIAAQAARIANLVIYFAIWCIE